MPTTDPLLPTDVQSPNCTLDNMRERADLRVKDEAMIDDFFQAGDTVACLSGNKHG